MKLLVISGGRHPYEESTPILDKFLNDAGHQVTVTEHASILADATKMAEFDALVFNTRRENAAGHDDLTLPKASQDGIIDYVKSGKDLCVSISLDVDQITGQSLITLQAVVGLLGQVSTLLMGISE